MTQANASNQGEVTDLVSEQIAGFISTMSKRKNATGDSSQADGKGKKKSDKQQHEKLE